MIKKTINFIRVTLSSSLLTFFVFLNKIYTSNIASSQLATGLDRLLKDLTS